MDMCRVRVVHERAAADVALPAELPLVDLIPDLAGLLLAPEQAGPWMVVHPVRGPLPVDASLAAAGVVDGTTLLLLDGTASAAPPRIVEDVAEAVVEVLTARAARIGRPLARWAGGVLLAAAALVLAVHAPLAPAAGVAALAVAVAASTLGAILARMPGRGGAGTALAAASVPWWSVATTALAAPGADPLSVASLAAGGAAAGLVAALATPGARRAAAGGLVAAAGAGAELALLDGFGHHAVRIAALAVVVLLGLLSLVPRIAVEISGLTLLEDGAAATEVVEGRVRAGRALQEWMQGGVLAGLLPAVAVLALANRPAPAAAVALLAAVLATRARRAVHSGESIPLAAAAALVATLLGAAVARAHPGAGAAIAAAAVAAAGALVLLASESSERARPAAHRAFDWLDIGLVAGLVVVCAAAASVFDDVAGLGG